MNTYSVWLSAPFSWLLIVATIGAVLGLTAVFALFRAMRERRPLRVLNRLLICALLTVTTLAAAFLALALHGYDRLTTEVPVARLHFQQVGPQRFEATVTTADDRRLHLSVLGDEWQLDARVVKWRPIAVLAGLDPVYRLDRLSGRYRDLERERSDARSVHDLTGGDRVDLWRLAERYPSWLPFVDTEYGSGAYLPMRDGASYEVTLSPLGGLIARTVEPDPEP